MAQSPFSSRTDGMAILRFVEALLGKLAIDEIIAWLTQGNSWLLRHAVSKLQPQDRERYAEEWAALLEITPGNVSKLIMTLGLLKAAWSIDRETNRPHPLVRAMYRTNGKVAILVLKDETLVRTKYQRIGQFLKITIPARLDETLIVNMLAGSGLRVYLPPK